MAEGVAVGGRVLGGGVLDDPDKPPPASPDAPKGWTWNRTAKVWQPKVRGARAWQQAEPGHPYPPTRPGGVDAVLGQQTPGAAPSDRQWSGNSGPGETPDGPAPGQDSGRDPAPAWMSQPEDAKPATARVKFDDVPAEVKADIASLGGLVATPILAVLASIDPYCGGALRDSFNDVFDATLPLICRSERVVKLFTEDTADWVLVAKIAMALAPVGKAIAEHHIFHTVQVVRDEQSGQVTILRATAGPDGQHLTPPAQPEYSPESYAA